MFCVGNGCVCAAPNGDANGRALCGLVDLGVQVSGSAQTVQAQ